MPLESATFINSLDPSNPGASDNASQGDDHVRLIKSTLKTTFPNITGAVTLTHTEINALLATVARAARADLVGEVKAWAGTTLPTGYLWCAGQAVSRTTYSALFAALSTTHGAGDGTTTFNLPDLRGRVVAGRDDMNGTSAARLSGVLSSTTLGASGGSQNLQSHTHGVTDPGHVHTASADTQGNHNHTASADTHGGHDHGITPVITANSGPNSGLGGGPGYAPTGTTSLTNVAGAHSHTVTIGVAGAHSHTVTVNSGTTGISIQAFGAGSSQNVQPTLVLNYIINAGV